MTREIEAGKEEFFVRLSREQIEYLTGLMIIAEDNYADSPGMVDAEDEAAQGVLHEAIVKSFDQAMAN